MDPELGLFAVADGMGGHAGGGTASSLAVETIRTHVRAAREADPGAFEAPGEPAGSKVPAVVRGAVEATCRSIYRAAQEDPSLAGMGTTVTTAAFAGRANLVTEEEIREVATREPLDTAPEKLVDLAKERGGDDNITVIVVKVDGEGKT